MVDLAARLGPEIKEHALVHILYRVVDVGAKGELFRQNVEQKPQKYRVIREVPAAVCNGQHETLGFSGDLRIKGDILPAQFHLADSPVAAHGGDGKFLPRRRDGVDLYQAGEKDVEVVPGGIRRLEELPLLINSIMIWDPTGGGVVVGNIGW